MEAGKAGSILIVLGLVSGAAGLVLGGFFWSNFLYLGISWFIAGLAYGFAGREVTEGGFLVAFLLGILGAILWLVVSRADVLEERVADLEQKLQRETDNTYFESQRKETKGLPFALNKHALSTKSGDIVDALIKKLRAEGHPNPEQLLETKIEQKLKTREEVLIEIYKSSYGERTVPPDSNAVIQALEWKYRQEGYLHPEQYLEGRIAERVKTREQALRELFNEEGFR